jgi:hypothetical protein
MDLLTTAWRLLILSATDVSVDNEVRTDTEPSDWLDGVGEYMWGKLSSIEYDKGVRLLQVRLGKQYEPTHSLKEKKRILCVGYERDRGIQDRSVWGN